MSDAELDANSPLRARWGTFVAVPAVFLVAAFANAAGTGGGPIMVPLFNVVVGFALKPATGLSQAVITGGALASVALNIFQEHPLLPGEGLIDTDIALMFTPMLLLGINTGVLLNAMFPDYLITLLLVLIIAAMAHKSISRGLLLRRKENALRLSKKALQAGPGQQPGQLELQARSAVLPQEGDNKSAHSATVIVEDDTTAPLGSRLLTPEALAALQRASQPCSGGGGATTASQAAAAATQLEMIELAESVASLHDDIHLSEAPLGELAAMRRLSASLSRAASGVEAAAPPLPAATSLSQSLDQQQLPAAAAVGGAGMDALPLRGGGGCRLHVPVASALALLVLWAAFLGLQLLRSQGTTACSPAYWGVYAGQILLMLVASAGFVFMALRRHGGDPEANAAAGTQSAPGARPTPTPMAPGAVSFTGLSYSWPSMLRNLGITLTAGVLAGLVGLGGAVMMGPIMLELGMHPQVAAATGAVMVLFSSSAAVFQFALPRRLNPGYAGLFAATSIAGSLLGILLVARFVRRTGRTSIIVLILGAVIALGGLVAGVFGAIDAADRFRSGTGTSFTDLCQSLS